MGIDDFLEDSLTYSPLKEIQNKENSPALFLKTLDRAKNSPSTARLFALLGGGSLDFRSSAGSFVDSKPVARRLEDLLNTPERSPPDPLSVESPRSSSELESLRASLAAIQKDCEFHRNRATHAQDELNCLKEHVAYLEKEKEKSDADDEKRRLSVLNASLGKQNDRLRSRSSVTCRFSKRDFAMQTDSVHTFDVSTGMDLVEHCSPIQMKSPQLDSPQPFMGTPSFIAVKKSRESGSQTVSGVWATVEQLDYNTRPSLPIRSKREPRKSQPEYLFVSRNDWRSLATVKRRGRSVGNKPEPVRPRWIP